MYLYFSDIVYNASCSNVSEYVVNELNKCYLACLDFYGVLVKGCKEKVGRRTTKEVRLGCVGLQMNDIECQINALLSQSKFRECLNKTVV